MSYTARGLLDMARSLADLQNSKFISFSDEISLINEAYRDIYSQYTESDGEYWLTELIITMIPAYNDPNNQYGSLVPLPADFLKIRSLSYNYGGVWYPCQRYSNSNRDYNPGCPQYRIINSNISVIGPRQSYSSLKLEYYPIPQVLTSPDSPLTLLSGETIYNYPNIGSHVYFPNQNVFIYALGNVIKCENINTGITSTLYTSANAIAGISFFAGYIFWLDIVTNNIYRAPTDFVSTLVPASIKTSVVNFSIQNSTVYYSTTSQTHSCAIDGSSDALVLSSATTAYTVYGSIYLSISGGYLVVNGVASAVPASSILTDGTKIFVYYNKNIYRYSLSTLNVPVLEAQVSTGIISIGSQIIGEYLSQISYDTAQAVSMYPDSVLSFPTNEVNEILAYTAANAYARKQSDQTKMALLSARLTELWQRFWSVNKRDEYQFQRINNDYRNNFVGM